MGTNLYKQVSNAAGKIDSPLYIPFDMIMHPFPVWSA